MGSERIEELERQIAELKRRWPAHSVPPTMLQQLDELEEELEREVNKVAKEKHSAKADGRAGL
jgi:ribosome-associated translation inhibitor RaiA